MLTSINSPKGGAAINLFIRSRPRLSGISVTAVSREGEDAKINCQLQKAQIKIVAPCFLPVFRQFLGKGWWGLTPILPNSYILNTSILRKSFHPFTPNTHLCYALGEGQYIIKNLVDISAGNFLGATVRGGKLLLTP